MPLIVPNVTAAFINNISEEGTKDEAVKCLQEQWNINCAIIAVMASIAYSQAKGADAKAMRNIAFATIWPDKSGPIQWVVQFLRDAGTADDPCWVPCAKDDKGAQPFVLCRPG